MNGFIKMLIADFAAFNAVATASYISNTGDTSITNYTYYNLDTDPLYCWTRIEHDFITEEIILSTEAALLAGMQLPVSVEN